MEEKVSEFYYEEGTIINTLQILHKEEAKYWQLLNDSRLSSKELLSNLKSFKDLFLASFNDVKSYLEEVERNENNRRHSREDVKPYFLKLEEISELLSNQIRRLESEINTLGLENVSDAILEEVLNHEKRENYAYSRLSQLLLEAIDIGEKLNNFSKEFEVNEKSYTFKDGVRSFLEGDLAQFALPEEIISYRLINPHGYDQMFWTSGSVVYSVEKKEIKLILSKNKNVNRLLDYDLIKNYKEFLPVSDVCSYDSVLEGRDVFIFSWDEDAPLKIKQVILSRISYDFQEYEFKDFRVVLLDFDSVRESQWRPIVVGHSLMDGNITTKTAFKIPCYFLFNKK